MQSVLEDMLRREIENDNVASELQNMRGIKAKKVQQLEENLQVLKVESYNLGTDFCFESDSIVVPTLFFWL